MDLKKVPRQILSVIFIMFLVVLVFFGALAVIPVLLGVCAVVVLAAMLLVFSVSLLYYGLTSVVVALVTAVPVTLIWDYVLAPIFHWPTFSFIQVTAFLTGTYLVLFIIVAVLASLLDNSTDS